MFLRRMPSPFDDWMQKLRDIIGKAAIEARLGLGKKYADIGDGLIELKVDVGPGYRIYLVDNGKDSLILCAGNKRTQKKDIQAAKNYWKEYKTRR
jgi:putative addiction module killer protein